MNKRDIDLIAACVGAAYADRIGTPEADGVWDVKQRLVLEMQLADPKFDTDHFSARVQYWYEQHGGERTL